MTRRSERHLIPRSPSGDALTPGELEQVLVGLKSVPSTFGVWTPPALHGYRWRAGRGLQSSEDRHAGRFLLALVETGLGGGDAGRRVHLVCAHGGLGIGIRRDHLDAAALLPQSLDLAL
jgi:hypothetical protein